MLMVYIHLNESFLLNRYNTLKYKKGLLLRCIQHFKSDFINN